MNKGLELIEAHFLFDFPSSKIQGRIHPQSILHGANPWADPQLLSGAADETGHEAPIGFAMGYPEKLPGVIPKLSMKDMAQLEFVEPDTGRFPALGLARDALESGPSHLVALNAGNEIAVESFLKGRLLFSQIAPVLSEVLSSHRSVHVDDLELPHLRAG